jgi:hypothetical protein
LLLLLITLFIEKRIRPLGHGYDIGPIEDKNQNGTIDTGETDPNNPDTDGDGDGIADCTYEDDSDGDGFSDAKEVLCGSDPENLNSKCRVGLPFLMLLLGD